MGADVRLVCVADTHGHHHRAHVPDGDILVHAGDLTRTGKLADVEEFDRWLNVQPHRYKVVIAGNHDFCFEEEPTRARPLVTGAVYLQDEEVTLGGVRIYGSPWQPYFGGWAFNLKTREELAAAWARIPDGLDVLVTHGPPAGILDRNRRDEPCGCRDLFDRVRDARPRVHVFGHIHESGGRTVEGAGTTFVNAATQLGHGRAVVVDL